jgi:cytoskeletal protein CcmA (bactofilin family)
MTHPDLSLSSMPSLDTPHVHQHGQQGAHHGHQSNAGSPPPRVTNFNPGGNPNESSFAEHVGKGTTADVLCETLDISMAIGVDDVIEGNIRIGGKKSLVIRGTVMGSIECAGRVLIMPGGKVQGQVRAAALWIEGDVGVSGKPANVDVGDLHLGINSKVIGDCTYDTLSVAVPNRGVRGQMIPRSEADHG